MAFGLMAAQQPIFRFFLAVADVWPKVHRAAALAEKNTGQGIDHPFFLYRRGRAPQLLNGVP